MRHFISLTEYGRFMHPLEGLKFSDGELNNAMGSDFYQRDHNNKISQGQAAQNPDDDSETDEDGD